MTTILVVDVGTCSVRSSVVDDDGSVLARHQVATLPQSPEPGQVEFDAHAMADAARHTALAALAEVGSVDAVGITNQRASTIVWDRTSGEPVGPGLGWQDLRTVVDCLVLQGQGIRVAPNVSATKVGWLLNQFDAERGRDLCFGTVDTWIAWSLSGGDAHVIDATNAAVTGMVDAGATRWDDAVLDAISIPHAHAADHRRHRRRIGDRDLAARPPADRRARRRPASQPRRPKLRAAGRGQDHVRHRRHARRGDRTRPAHGRDALSRRVLPDRRVAPRRRDGVGPRGRDALRGHVHRVVARRPQVAHVVG